MDLASFRALLTPRGQEALEAAAALAPREADFLRHFSALSKGYPRDLARAALETAILRTEAGGKFPHAGRMYFTRQALEQASGWAVSCYRAGRYRDYNTLLDLGCSIGADTLAMMEHAPTIGIDRDPLRLAMARANLAALGLGAQAFFIQADLTEPLPLHPMARTALFFDPARRRAGRRVYTVAQYTPPLAVIERWLPDYPALGVKISPGVDLNELASYDAEVEFVSHRGELKEAVLWFGPLKSARRRATVLPGPHTLVASEADSGREDDARLPLSEPRTYLYEPDPAILRAGLVQDLGQALEAAQLDADIAYLTAECQVETPFARAWAVEDWMPFGLKRLRAALRDRNVGRVTVKKRGSPLQPEELIRALRLKADAGDERVLFLTHLRGRPIVVICYPEG
jgi:hypothetical protein